jgi:hypothetical protein
MKPSPVVPDSAKSYFVTLGPWILKKGEGEKEKLLIYLLDFWNIKIQ